MNASDSAEEVVKLTLEGTEVAFRLAGEGAKNIIVMIHAIMQDNKQTKSKMNLTNILKANKPLNIFPIRAEDLAKFSKEAKKYGVRYCALTNKKDSKIDGIVDVMVFEEDAPKINRIVERFNFRSVEDIKEEMKKDKEIKMIPEKTENEQFIDDIMPRSKEDIQQENPSNDNEKTENENLSEIYSNTISNEKMTNSNEEKKSVIQELKEIEQELKEQEEKEVMQQEISNAPAGTAITKDKEKEKEIPKKEQEHKKGKHYKEPKHFAPNNNRRRKRGKRERGKE